MKLNNKGYTLVEILGVMVILGILATIGLVSFTRYRKNAAEQSFQSLSDNAASAAEEYFMDHFSAETVEINTLVEGNYLENAVDPYNKKYSCNGSVEKFSTSTNVAGKVDVTSLKVVVNCPKTKKDSCKIYPSSMECDADDGIITDGVNQYYDMGVGGGATAFGSSMSLAIRVKFNELGKTMEYFGNWECGGGGLGLDPSDHFWFSLCHKKSDCAYTRITASSVAYKNRWYIVVGVLDNGKMSIYVDGEKLKNNAGADYVELPTATGAPDKSAYSVLVGGNPQGSRPLLYPAPITSSAAIVYGRALTQSEIEFAFSSPSRQIDFSQIPSDYLAAKKFS